MGYVLPLLTLLFSQGGSMTMQSKPCAILGSTSHAKLLEGRFRQNLNNSVIRLKRSNTALSLGNRKQFLEEEFFIQS